MPWRKFAVLKQALNADVISPGAAPIEAERTKVMRMYGPVKQNGYHTMEQHPQRNVDGNR